MLAWGDPSISKIMFAHIALLGFQRADGLLRRILSQSICLLIGTTNTIPCLLVFASKHEKFSITSCHRVTFGHCFSAVICLVTNRIHDVTSFYCYTY